MPELRKKRFAMSPVGDVMQAWAEALRREVADWPGVTVRRSFGMSLIYRGDIVFAALPGTRSLYTDDAILLKFQCETPVLARRIAAEPHFAPGTMAAREEHSHKRQGESRKWRIFLLRCPTDIHPAIEWLAEAYENARAADRRQNVAY